MTPFDFRDRRVVLTGGGVGIGLETVRRFAAAGARVASADIRLTPELVEATEGSGGFALELDLAEPEGPGSLVNAAAERFGGIDVLVNNLGASPVRESFELTTDDEWARLFEINFFSAVRAVRAALPHLKLAEDAAVVSIASVLAREPITIQPDYCATKAALLNLSKNLAAEYGPAGVRFVCVSPGPTLTPQWTDPGGQVEQYAVRAGITPEAALATGIPQALGLSIGRLVRPDEIASTVLFAASSMAGAMTGNELLVDAGMRRAF